VLSQTVRISQQEHGKPSDQDKRSCCVGYVEIFIEKNDRLLLLEARHQAFDGQ
jgi:hypothetical protein